MIARDTVEARGPDTFTFLQGQLSQDVSSLAVGASAWSLLLHPDGKVVAWLRVTRTADDAALLDVDAGGSTAVIERLSRFKIRTKCDFEVAAHTFAAVRARAGEPVPDPASDARTLPIVWPGFAGYDVLDPGDDTADAGGTVDDYEAARIEAGVPTRGHELTDRTIPAEAGQWLIDASVSFTKGCYTGQELVARIDSRGGNVPRPIRGLVVTDGPMPPIGATVVSAGEPVGVITSVANSAAIGAPIALAPVARKVEIPSAVTLQWEDGAAAARLEPLPLRAN